MSLSAIASLSITQNSLFNELANAANSTNSATSTPSSSAANSTAAASGTANADGTSGTSASDTLANDLASLLKSLGSGDVKGAQAALTKVEADLKADDSSSSTSSSASGTSATQSSSSLTKLLSQLSSALNSGDTNTAMQDLTSFLLNAGQGSGSSVNVTA